MELILFDGKDCISAIDDLEKDGSIHETQRRVALLESALWALGGNARGRNTSSGDYRASKPCRTSLILTGQDTCLKKSGVARMLILDVPQLMSTEHKKDYLTVAGWGSSGVLNQFMASWLNTMAKGVDDLKADLKESIGQLMGSLGATGHARTNSSLASLLGVWPLILKWAQEEGAITSSEAEAYWSRVYNGCLVLTDSASAEVESTDPVNIFLQLPSLLRTKVCHLTDCRTSMAPTKMPEVFGWVDGRPCGQALGYVDLPSRKIYLEETAFNFINSKLGMGHDWITLKKLLNQRGLLAKKAVGGDGGLKAYIPGNHGRGYCISMDSFKDWSGPEWDQLTKELIEQVAKVESFPKEFGQRQEMLRGTLENPS